MIIASPDEEKSLWLKVRSAKPPTVISLKQLFSKDFVCPSDYFFVGCKFCQCDKDDRTTAHCEPSTFCPKTFWDSFRDKVDVLSANLLSPLLKSFRDFPTTKA